jgi:probable rRNA maturation factor
MKDPRFSISISVRSLPRLSLAALKREILGPDYDLSLHFVGTTRAQKLNQSYRGKDYIPNVLSFPLAHDVGEIFICPSQATKEAPAHGLSVAGYLTYLFIHGALHLKGYDHGATMSALEQRYTTKYAVK